MALLEGASVSWPEERAAIREISILRYVLVPHKAPSYCTTDRKEPVDCHGPRPCNLDRRWGALREDQNVIERDWQNNIKIQSKEPHCFCSSHSYGQQSSPTWQGTWPPLPPFLCPGMADEHQEGQKPGTKGLWVGTVSACDRICSPKLSAW